MKEQRSSSLSRKKGLTVSLCENKANLRRACSVDKQNFSIIHQLSYPHTQSLTNSQFHTYPHSNTNLKSNSIKYLQQSQQQHLSHIPSNMSTSMPMPMPMPISTSMSNTITINPNSHNYHHNNNNNSNLNHIHNPHSHSQLTQSPLPVVIYRYNKSQWQKLQQSNHQKRDKIHQLQQQLISLSKNSCNNTKQRNIDQQYQCGIQQKISQKQQKYNNRNRFQYIQGYLQSTGVLNRKYQQLQLTPKTTMFNPVQIGKQLPVIDQIKQQNYIKINDTGVNAQKQNANFDVSDHINRTNIQNSRNLITISENNINNHTQQTFSIRINPPTSQKQRKQKQASPNKQNVFQVKQISNFTTFTLQKQNKNKGMYNARRKPIDVNSLQEIQNRLNYLIDFTKF